MAISWTKLSEGPLRAGFRAVVRRAFRLPDGTAADFDIKQEGPVVCALALTARNTVILARQFRPGPEMILAELPGGAVDAGETPEDAVRRELIEETGYTGDIQYVGSAFDCAYSTRVKHSFVATSCYKVSEPQHSEHEFVEVVEIGLDKFRAHLRSGRLTDVEAGYLGLDFLKLL